RDKHVRTLADEVGGELHQPLAAASGEMEGQLEAASLDVAKVTKASPQRLEIRALRVAGREDADTGGPLGPHLSRSGAHAGRKSEQELPPLHSITSSARARREGGN